MRISDWSSDVCSSDLPAGYYRRFSEGLGLGVRLLDRPGLRLDMDGGPAFRQTAFIASGEEKELSGRASMAFRWDITPRLGFSQDASAFLADNSRSEERRVGKEWVSKFRSRWSA